MRYFAIILLCPLLTLYGQGFKKGLPTLPRQVRIEKAVAVSGYFQYMDSLAAALQPGLPYPISEHLIAHANPGLIHTLSETDYYRLMARDSFVYDQQQLVILRPGDRLRIPGAREATALYNALDRTWIDVNIPEFRLRIYRDSLLLYAFPIRVGQNRTRYLKTAGREEDLRTKTGKGIIVEHNRFPDFYNPVDGKRFYTTRRDDGKTTLMPQIPWMHTSINGIRYGQMIHPTTNPETLGKAYSNGCIGLGEADSWVLYYYAPVGTRIRIRYDLRGQDEQGREHVFADIYGYGPTRGAAGF